jgi:hypothetical protein
LPVIFSLLSLWLVLFIFFGILFLEVFSLTKWNTAETPDQNYSTMGASLVMLVFMTTGCVRSPVVVARIVRLPNF